MGAFLTLAGQLLVILCIQSVLEALASAKRQNQIRWAVILRRLCLYCGLWSSICLKSSARYTLLSERVWEHGSQTPAGSVFQPSSNSSSPRTTFIAQGGTLQSV